MLTAASRHREDVAELAVAELSRSIEVRGDPEVLAVSKTTAEP